MLKRLLLAVVVFGGLVQPAPAVAASLFAQLFPLTGEIRLLNKSATPVPIIFYSIESDSGALNSSNSVWKSITNNYDAPTGATPGNGFVDPNAEWMKIASSSVELAEGAFTGPGGSLLPWRPVSLGKIWNPNATPFPDLMFQAREPNTQAISVTPEFALEGDYFPDGVVNQTDYSTWRQYFGSTSILFADGNLNGIVDAADYVVWRKNLGKSIPSTAVGSANNAALPRLAASVSVVPEPSTIALGFAAAGWLLHGMKRRRR